MFKKFPSLSDSGFIVIGFDNDVVRNVFVFANKTSPDEAAIKRSDDDKVWWVSNWGP